MKNTQKTVLQADISDVILNRKWVPQLKKDPSNALLDWEPFCQSTDGVKVVTRFVDIPPKLPRQLQSARNRLKKFIIDEHSLYNPNAPFNGPRFYLRNVVPEVRRFGEIPTCILEFGPSDYRTFLVTNGMNSHWASLSGLSDVWKDPVQWWRKWHSLETSETFFDNSFGVNVLITCKDGGKRYALFCERSEKVSVGRNTTVGSADEGLRRKFGRLLFDEISSSNPAPNLIKAAHRAIYEEIGISARLVEGVKPIILSVGRVRSLHQPAALIHWPLKLSVDEVLHCASIAQDKNFEISKFHFVPFDRENIIDFIIRQEKKAPVASWVAAMAVYALGSLGIRRKKVFISYSHADRRIVNSLANILEENGISIWLDEREIFVGDSLIMRLRSAIDEVDYVIAVLSKSSVESKWVQEELATAITQQIEGKKVKVLPVLIDDCALPGFLLSRVYADFRDKKGKTRVMENLIRAINGIEN